MAKVKITSVTIRNAKIIPSAGVDDLGAVLGTEMTIFDDVNTIAYRLVGDHLRNSGRIRRFLCSDTCKQNAHAPVTSLP